MNTKVMQKGLAMFLPRYIKQYNNSWEKAKAKIYKNNKWVQIGESDIIPDISEEPEEIKYNWVYHEFYKNNPRLKEFYIRCYNTLKYNGTYDYVKYKDFQTGKYMVVPSIRTFDMFDGSFTQEEFLNLKGLCVELSDLNFKESNVTDEEYHFISRVEYCLQQPDCIYLPMFDAFSVRVKQIYSVVNDGMHYDGTSRNITKVYFAFISSKEKHPDNFIWGGYNGMCETIENTFKEICKKVKRYYGIEYVNRGYAANNKFYTEKQKLQIAKCIHDYIITHTTYNYRAVNTSFDTEELFVNFLGAHNLFGAMSDGIAEPVCESYAKAFQYCCWRWGITCFYISGIAGVGHAWNIVTYKPYTILDREIYDKSIWQFVDCTWDDIGSGHTSQNISWDYFNLPGNHHRISSRTAGTYPDVYYYPHGEEFMGYTCSENMYFGNELYGGIS